MQNDQGNAAADHQESFRITDYLSNSSRVDSPKTQPLAFTVLILIMASLGRKLVSKNGQCLLTKSSLDGFVAPKETMMHVYNRQHQLYCGVHLHDKTMHVCVVDHQKKKRLHRNFSNSDPHY
jgi:hypothetical protein